MAVWGLIRLGKGLTSRMLLGGFKVDFGFGLARGCFVAGVQLV